MKPKAFTEMIYVTLVKPNVNYLSYHYLPYYVFISCVYLKYYTFIAMILTLSIPIQVYMRKSERDRERGRDREEGRSGRKREVITSDTGMYIIRVHAIPACHLNEIPADSNLLHVERPFKRPSSLHS